MKYEFNYDIKTVQYEKEKKLLDKTDILIISVNDAEREGILKYLLPVPSYNAIIKFIHNSVMHRTPAASRGWAGRGNLMWKFEDPAMNLGIQQNTHMFNPWIESFKIIP